MGEGQASRTNHASRGSVGAGRARPPRSRAIDAHQPVAPVPVETIRPGRGLALRLAAGRGELVPGGLVRGVSDENFVERRQFLAVVEPCGHRGELLAAQPLRRPARAASCSSFAAALGRVPDQDARDSCRAQDRSR